MHQYTVEASIANPRQILLGDVGYFCAAIDCFQTVFLKVGVYSTYSKYAGEKSNYDMTLVDVDFLFI